MMLKNKSYFWFNLLVWLSDYSSTFTKANDVGSLKCQNNGVCFTRDYDKNVPPNSSDVEVIMIPPLITNLREVNVLKSTLTIDIYYAGMEWSDPRLILNENFTSTWNSSKYNIGWAGTPYSFEEYVWLPGTLLKDLKSAKRKSLRKFQSGKTFE